MKATTVTSQLIRDLWNFIENVSDDDPERTEKFFALRERVREFYGSEGQKQHKSKS